jgi:hypothetical protein
MAESEICDVARGDPIDFAEQQSRSATAAVTTRGRPHFRGDPVGSGQQNRADLEGAAAYFRQSAVLRDLTTSLNIETRIAETK